MCVVKILSFWLYTDFYADHKASLGTGSDRTAMAKQMFKLSRNFIYYGATEQNFFFSLRQKFGTSEHQLHLIFAQTALVSIRCRPALIFYFPFSDSENYDIFSVLEVKVIYKDMQPSFSQRSKMSGKSNVSLNMS